MSIKRSVVLVDQDDNSRSAIYVDNKLAIVTEATDLEEIFDSVGLDYIYVKVLADDFDRFPDFFDLSDVKKWVGFFIEKDQIESPDEMLERLKERIGSTFYYTETDRIYLFAVKPERLPLAVQMFPIQSCDVRSISEQDYEWKIEPDSE